MRINDPYTWRKSCLENSLTERTSTKSVLRLSLCIGSDVNTASVDRMDVHSRTTSGCSSQKSFASLPPHKPKRRKQGKQIRRQEAYQITHTFNQHIHSYFETHLWKLLKPICSRQCQIWGAGLDYLASQVCRIELINLGSYILSC